MDIENNEIVNAFFDIITQLNDRIPKNFVHNIQGYCVGGIAMSYWIGPARRTSNIDIIFNHNIFFNEIKFEKNNIDLILDHNFNASVSALQKDYPSRATFIKQIGKINIFVISPEDIVIMKILRWNVRDRIDIISLIHRNLLHKDKLYALYNDFRNYYIGNSTNVQYAFDDVIEMIDQSTSQ
ncbi:MAG: hypothetical protein IJU79_02950 [Desulfovibrionaceae bacterium]|nr:hypothetical protein [Desulfovibrionaceae bacterium]